MQMTHSEILYVIFSFLTALFSFFAWRNTIAKFRLDLLEQRWKVFVQIRSSCVELVNLRTLPNTEDMYKAKHSAGSGFREENLYLISFLFGQDILALTWQLNTSWSFITTYIGETGLDENIIKQYYWHKKFVSDTIDGFPVIFRRYMYFGDYRTGNFFERIQKAKEAKARTEARLF